METKTYLNYVCLNKYSFCHDFLLFTEARTEDVFTSVTANGTNFTLSSDEIKEILASADLEGLGYEKEEITTNSKDNKGNAINAIIQYFKKVPCSNAPKTFKELKDRISG